MQQHGHCGAATCARCRSDAAGEQADAAIASCRWPSERERASTAAASARTMLRMTMQRLSERSWLFTHGLSPRQARVMRRALPRRSCGGLIKEARRRITYVWCRRSSGRCQIDAAPAADISGGEQDVSTGITVTTGDARLGRRRCRRRHGERASRGPACHHLRHPAEAHRGRHRAPPCGRYGSVGILTVTAEQLHEGRGSA